MKTYKIEITIDDNKWVGRGTIKGKKESAVLRRAFHETFPRSAGYENRFVGNTVFHAKYRDMPVLRIVEVV